MTFEVWFHEYVFGFMLGDVSREIAAAGRGEAAANFLCAIGLLTYTETLGAHVPGVKRGSRNRFEGFFRYLGPQYITFLEQHSDTYDVFRNGLVHEYRVKQPASIVMLANDREVPCGMMYKTPEQLAAEDEAAFAENEEDAFWLRLAREIAPKRTEGHFYFVVQRYFRDFVVAADRLHRELVGHRHPLIHIYAPELLPERS